jgi:hypothetical protein
MGELSFVQISDSYVGLNKLANPDVAGTLKAEVDKINGLSVAPAHGRHQPPFEAVAAAIVALTGHLGGFLSGVKGFG